MRAFKVPGSRFKVGKSVRALKPSCGELAEVNSCSGVLDRTLNFERC